MRILITGSNGLLGQKLVSALRRDPEVELIATSRGADRTPEPLGAHYRPLDITVATEVDTVFDAVRPDVVIHTAAMTNVDACEQDPEGCRLQNVVATEQLVRAAKRHGGRRHQPHGVEKAQKTGSQRAEHGLQAAGRSQHAEAKERAAQAGEACAQHGERRCHGNRP